MLCFKDCHDNNYHYFVLLKVNEHSQNGNLPESIINFNEVMEYVHVQYAPPTQGGVFVYTICGCTSYFESPSLVPHGHFKVLGE